MWKSKYIFFLVLILVGCKTPAELVEKAISKDANVLSEYADTVTLTRIEIDSFEVVIGDTVIWEKVVREIEVDTVFNVKVIKVPEKKSRFEIRKEYQLEKALIKKEKEIEKLQAKLDAKNERAEIRHETKQERSRNRWWLWFIIGAISMLVFRMLLDRLWKSIFTEP